MINATLKYHTRVSNNKTYIYLSISNGTNNRFRIFPNIRLNNRSNWDQNKEKIKITPSEPNAKIYNDKLYEFKAHFIERLKECYKNDISLDKEVIKRIEKTFGNSVTNKKIKLSNEKFDLTKIWTEFIVGMESGLYKHKTNSGKKPYSKNTIQNHKGSLNKWAEYEKKFGKILPHQIN